MKPSSTTRGGQWLAQFDPPDAPLAAKIIDSLRFAPSGDVLAGVRRLIESLVDSGQVVHPTALLPALSIEDIEFPRGAPTPQSPVVFADFDPSQGLSGAPGSEALMANVIREINRAAPKLYARHPITLKKLRDRRVRNIVVVTDYIGSGQQILDYVGTWTRNSTIRSWRSGGFIKIIVVAYAVTPEGRSLVEASPAVSQLEYLEIAPTVYDWNLVLKNPDIVELCSRYAKRAGLSGDPMGYRGSGGLFVSALSVPNNLPAILIRQSPTWTPFFHGRSARSELSDELGTYTPGADYAALLRGRRQTRLAARVDEDAIPVRWRMFVVALALLPASEDQLARAMGISVSECRTLLDTLKRLGLVDGMGKVTPGGSIALAHHRRKGRVSPPVPTPTASAYYPQSLR